MVFSICLPFVMLCYIMVAMDSDLTQDAADVLIALAKYKENDEFGNTLA